MIFFVGIDEDTDSDISASSDSPNEHQNIKKKIMETKRGQSSSSKTMKRPRGRPPKVVKEKLMKHKEG
jgi:hypothetical protein